MSFTPALAASMALISALDRKLFALLSDELRPAEWSGLRLAFELESVCLQLVEKAMFPLGRIDAIGLVVELE